MLVEREVGDQPFQPAILFLKLPESAQLAHTEVDILFLPGIERLLGNPELPAQVTEGVLPSACRRA